MILKRGEKLEHFVTTERLNENAAGKEEKKNHREKMLDRLSKWSGVGGVTDALKQTGDRNAWKVMIAHARKQGREGT